MQGINYIQKFKITFPILHVSFPYFARVLFPETFFGSAHKY
jgi:hypothetical protein